MSVAHSDYGSRLSQILSTVVGFLGVSVISFCFARRIPQPKPSIGRALLSLSWARIAVLGVFIDSWIFLLAVGIIVNGVGTQTNYAACQVGIYMCVIFYVISKLFIYFFLAERVYVVWGASAASTRLQSLPYKLCVFVVASYAVVIASMFAGRRAILRDDKTCFIGLTHWAGIPLLTYDLVINVMLTSLFVLPIIRENFGNPTLRRVAIRTSLAAGVSLTTSTVNILVLMLMKGLQEAWICLACCSADVAVNAIAIFWVTSGPEKIHRFSKTQPQDLTPVTMEFARRHNASLVTSVQGTSHVIGDDMDKDAPSTTTCVCTDWPSSFSDANGVDPTKTWPIGSPGIHRIHCPAHVHPPRISSTMERRNISTTPGAPAPPLPTPPALQLSPRPPSISLQLPPAGRRIPSPPGYFELGNIRSQPPRSSPSRSMTQSMPEPDLELAN